MFVPKGRYTGGWLGESGLKIRPASMHLIPAPGYENTWLIIFEVAKPESENPIEGYPFL